MKGSKVRYGGRIFWGNFNFDANVSILVSYRADSSLELCRLVADQGVDNGWRCERLAANVGAETRRSGAILNWVAGRRRMQVFYVDGAVIQSRIRNT